MTKDIPEDFGHWFAGLTDGEGYFGIHRHRRLDGGHYYVCRFVIALRIDDAPILFEIQRTLGVGFMQVIHRPPANPQQRWSVTRKDQTPKIVALFERFPLRAKKARDFRIWAEAVRASQSIINGQTADWSYHARLRDQLRDIRGFSDPYDEDVTAPEPYLGGHEQLRLAA